MNKIHCNFNRNVLVPIEALDGMKPGEYRTDDGKLCVAEFISGWNNRDGRYDEQLEHLCQSVWGIPFATIKSRWFAQVGQMEGFWYFIKLREKDGTA